MSIIKETASGYMLLPEEDLLLTSRKVFLTDEVNHETISALIKKFMALEAQSDEEITFFINSPGGDVLSGLALFDFIKTMKSPVKTVCIGTCYSMGAILFLSGKDRLVFPHSRLMIHDPSYSANDIGGKKPHEIQQQVDKLMETRNVLARIIAEVTNHPLDEILKLTSEDSYYNAKEALSFGLATKIINNKMKGDLV